MGYLCDRPVCHTILISAVTLRRKEVGDAIKKSGIDRSEFFVTTKVIGAAEGLDPQETYDALVKGVEAFGLGTLRFLRCAHRLY